MKPGEELIFNQDANPSTGSAFVNPESGHVVGDAIGHGSTRGAVCLGDDDQVVRLTDCEEPILFVLLLC